MTEVSGRIREAGTFQDQWLAHYLVDGGLVARDALLGLHSAERHSLWSAVVESGLATDAAIVDLLATAFHLALADLRNADTRISGLLPSSIARKHRVLPLTATDRSIEVATADPRNLTVEQEIEWVTGRAVQFKLAAPDQISARLDEIYQPEDVINRLLSGLTVTPPVEVAARPMQTKEQIIALDAPMSRLVNAIISDAYLAEASDIHSEIEGREVVIRYRIDGILREIMRLPDSAGGAFVRRVKVVAGLDVTNSMIPQDGRASVRVGQESVDLRVATAPVAPHGEKLVIRLLSKQNLKASIPDLALAAPEEAVLRRMIGHRSGVILVTGPTGSGKTTTLYAVLNHLRTGAVNIVTVEDPVEYDVDGISQMQVNEAQGFTFATALKSVLRQDPDIVLVGEIRDQETATIAVQAGLTGHLVFSTLHTNDAVSAVARLRDMQVESFKIGSTVRGIVAQRLVRKLCDLCAEPIAIDQLPIAFRPTSPRLTAATPRRAVGCKACGNSGYRGRTAVMEFFPIEGEVPRLIDLGAPFTDLVAAARPHGMQSLWEGGLLRVWSGATSAEEIIRVIGEPAAAVAPNRPVAPASVVTQQGEDRREKNPAAPTSILIADDDASMRRLLAAVLSREGYRITEAVDGLEALEAVEAGEIDLVVLDHDMPNLTGLGVLEELRARLPTATLPVIMLTARTDDTEYVALELGAQDYLTKPVQPRSLVARVQAVLRRMQLS